MAAVGARHQRVDQGDLPTPECPTSTLTRPAQPLAQRRRARRRCPCRVARGDDVAAPRAARRWRGAVPGRRRSALVSTAAAPSRRRTPRPGTGRSAAAAARGRRARVTMTSWSALATMTRSTGSVSSAVRRSTVARGVDPHDPGQRVRRRRRCRRPAPTRSPTTTPLRPSSRAFIAVTDALGALVDQAACSGRGRRR